MKMIVGLGNPGSNYQESRHNFGFMAIDHWSNLHNVNVSNFKEHKQCLIAKIKLPIKNQGCMGYQDLLLVKPLTYMNLSGIAVQQIMLFYKISLLNMLVITEDINLPFGIIKFKPKGGTGGHNGLKSLHQYLGCDTYYRLRFGVDYNQKIPLERYVLSNFSKLEQKSLPEYLNIVSDCVTDFISNLPIEKLMSKYNGTAN